NALNATFYYEDDKLSARVSIAQRDQYYNPPYPIASGAVAPGFGDSPLINDFVGSKATLNVDAAATYNINKYMAVRFEALNLTNQTINRFGYAADQFVTQYGSTGRQFNAGIQIKY